MKDQALRLLGILLALALVGLACSSSDDDGTEPDLDVPEVMSVSPADGAIHVEPWATITVEFSIPMDEGTVEQATTLSSTTRSEVSFSPNWLAEDVMQIDPDEQLEFGTLYTLTIGTGAESAEGQPVAAAFTSDFTTLPDHPVVLSTVPADGAAGVILNAIVHIQFSIEMDAASTVDALGVDPAVPYTVNFGGDNLSMDFDELLAPSTTYTITVDASASAEGLGSTLGEDYVFSFTTGLGADTDPPYIVSYSPANGATQVDPDIGEIVITFSEPVQSDVYPDSMDLRLMMLQYMNPIFSPDGTQMTVPFLRLPEGCTLWVDLAPFQDVAGNWSDDPPIYSVTTAGTADFFPAGLNDWWEYVGGEGEMSGYLIKTANVYAGDFDLNRYLPDFPGPQPEEYTVLNQIRHFAREGNILYWDGANERHEGDIWSGYTFDPPIQWLHFPLELGRDWQGQSDFEMDEDPARVSYTAEVTAILDYHPEWRGQLSHSTPSWSEGRQDFALVFPDCAEVTLSYEIEVYREGDWHPAQVATETALYCPGLGLVRSHAEGTDYSEGGPVEYVDDHYLIGWLVGQ